VRLRLIGLAVVAPVLAGCLSAGEPQALMVCDPSVADRCVPVSEGSQRAEASPAPAQAPAPRVEVAGARFRLSTFTGKHFSVAYPAGWRVETADAWNGTYLDTTIRSSRSPATYLRVDVADGNRDGARVRNRPHDRPDELEAAGERRVEQDDVRPEGTKAGEQLLVVTEAADDVDLVETGEALGEPFAVEPDRGTQTDADGRPVRSRRRSACVIWTAHAVLPSADVCSCGENGPARSPLSRCRWRAVGGGCRWRA
jgi:hypothetical protein